MECKGNIGEEKRTVDSVKFEFCDEITKNKCERKRKGVNLEKESRRKG